MGNREAIQPRKIYRTEAEVILLTAGRKNQPITRGWGESVGVNRAWRAHKGNTCIPGRSASLRETVVASQDFGNQGCGEGLAEVGLLHSSKEVGESRWSEGSGKCTARIVEMAQYRGRRGSSSKEACESRGSKGPKVQTTETKPEFRQELNHTGNEGVSGESEEPYEARVSHTVL